MFKKIVFASVIISIFLISCAQKKNIPTAPTDQTPPAVYIAGKVMQLGGNAYVGVILDAGSSTGTSLSGAVVTVNGTTIPETVTPGFYGITITGGFLDGTAITINAITTLGTVTGSAVMPTGAGITAPANNSTMSHASAIQINWANPGPDGSEVWIYTGNPTIPTLNTQINNPTAAYSIPANTLAVLPGGYYYMSVLAEKIMPFTNAVSTSSYMLYNSANTFTETIN